MVRWGTVYDYAQVYHIFSIKRPRRLFKIWQFWPGVFLRPAFNQGPAFNNEMRFQPFFLVDFLLPIPGNLGAVCQCWTIFPWIIRSYSIMVQYIRHHLGSILIRYYTNRKSKNQGNIWNWLLCAGVPGYRKTLERYHDRWRSYCMPWRKQVGPMCSGCLSWAWTW